MLCDEGESGAVLERRGSSEQVEVTLSWGMGQKRLWAPAAGEEVTALRGLGLG